MNIKTDPENEGWRASQDKTLEPEPKRVDMRTKEGRAQKARDQLAREAQLEARREQTTKIQETEKSIGGALGTMNEGQLNRRNEIANAKDEKEDWIGDEADQTEALAKKVEDDAQAERERLEAEANERAAEVEQKAGVVEAEPKKYKLKVNGKEIELTEAELLEKAQKVASADEYLQTASKGLERVQALVSSKDGLASGEEDPIEDTLTSALQGDSEAIKKVAQRLRAPPIKDVLSAVDDRMSFRSAAEWARGEFKEVFADPMLYRLMVDEDTQLARLEPGLSYRDRLTRAAKTVSDWKASLAPKAEPTPPNPKLERKASVLPIIQAAGRQVVRDEEDEEEPVETVIERMAKARGLQGAIRK